MKGSIMVIAAHPDDEVLGCGAAIAKHVKCGEQVDIMILAEGLTSRDERRDRGSRAKELSQLAESARQASRILGVNSLSLHDFPDNRMDSCDLLDIVKVIEAALARHKPRLVYTHHAGDVNIDHQIIHQAVVTACRPYPGQSVKTLLFFEIPSSTEWQTAVSSIPFLPNWYVDVSETIAQKNKALEAYSNEIHSWPHPRSLEAIEHLARWRGATIGVQAAEAFVMGRNII